jgi:NADH:ubiquinone oxidoreductase subunit H
MGLVIWVARVNPRSRVDQVTDFAWKVLSPFSLLALIGTVLWTGWRAVS